MSGRGFNIYQASADWYETRTSALAPDEIMHEKLKIGKIPLYERNELKSRGIRLPSSDLLNALHYYTSHKIHGTEMLNDSERTRSRMLDESALLALGVAMETWIESAVGGTGATFQEDPTEQTQLRVVEGDAENADSSVDSSEGSTDSSDSSDSSTEGSSS